jgi:hypothetical protein
LSLVSTPLTLDMSMQSQNSGPETWNRETNRPLRVRPTTLKRPALEPISGNLRARKACTRDIKE